MNGEVRPVHKRVETRDVCAKNEVRDLPLYLKVEEAHRRGLGGPTGVSG